MMKEMNEQDIKVLIAASPWHIACLRAAASLSLPDWCIGAGFVRGAVWDHLHGYADFTPLSDVDLVYFDPTEAEGDAELSDRVSNIMPGVNWEVVNQAHAHEWNDDAPYSSTADAMSKWPETATAVGVRLGENDEITVMAPHGLGDLITLTIRPTPRFAGSPEKMRIFRERIEEKGWLKKWPKLKTAHD